MEKLRNIILLGLLSISAIEGKPTPPTIRLNPTSAQLSITASGWKANMFALLHRQHSWLLNWISKTSKNPKAVIGLASAFAVIMAGFGVYNFFSRTKTLDNASLLLKDLHEITRSINPQKLQTSFMESLRTEAGQKTLEETIVTIGRALKRIQSEGTVHSASVAEKALVPQILQSVAHDSAQRSLAIALVKAITETGCVAFKSSSTPILDTGAGVASTPSAHPEEHSAVTALKAVVQDQPTRKFIQETGKALVETAVKAYVAADAEHHPTQPTPSAVTTGLQFIKDNPGVAVQVAAPIISAGVAAYATGNASVVTPPPAIPKPSWWQRAKSQASRAYNSAKTSILSRFVPTYSA